MILGVIWLLAHWRRRYWFSGVALFLMVFAAAFGIWRGFPAAWMLLGALGSLLGWDLSDFAVQLRYAPQTDDVREMERRHLARVGVVAVLGIGLAFLGFILLAALVLARSIVRLRRY
jgi:membrane protein YqaA with SNARE-associated domain